MRLERPGDEAAIFNLTQAAFSTVSHSLHNEGAILNALRQADALTLSLVAVSDDTPVGHVALSPVELQLTDDSASNQAASAPDKTIGWFGLGPVAVLPAHQGQGIGRQLIRQALTMLKSRGANGVVVLGAPAYYRRFGFKPALPLELAGAPAEYFQALSFSSTPPAAHVRYHDAFSSPKA